MEPFEEALAFETSALASHFSPGGRFLLFSKYQSKTDVLTNYKTLLQDVSSSLEAGPRLPATPTVFSVELLWASLLWELIMSRQTSVDLIILLGLGSRSHTRHLSGFRVYFVDKKMDGIGRTMRLHAGVFFSAVVETCPVIKSSGECYQTLIRLESVWCPSSSTASKVDTNFKHLWICYQIKPVKNLHPNSKVTRGRTNHSCYIQFPTPQFTLRQCDRC